MFLRFFIIILSIFLLASVFDNPNNFDNVQLNKDIRILESIHQRKPGDLKILKMLVQNYFLKENFSKVILFSSKFLTLKKDKEIAYLKIISLINSNKKNKAYVEIEDYLSDYNLTNEELEIVNYKKSLIKNKYASKGFPDVLKKSKWIENKIVLSILERDGMIFGRDLITKSYFFYPIGKNNTPGILKIPKYLNDVNLDKTIYISQSFDGLEVLISQVVDVDRSEILYRYYDEIGNSWSDLKKIKNINLGKWNSHGNFINNYKSIIFLSDLNGKTGKDFFISNRTAPGTWSPAIRLDKISSPLDEYSIFVHPDGETIYFSSNGFKGLGGFDIYGCKVKFEDEPVFYNFKNLNRYNSFRNEKFPIIVNSDVTKIYSNFASAGKSKILNTKYLSLKPKKVFYSNEKVYSKKRDVIKKLDTNNIKKTITFWGIRNIKTKRYIYQRVNREMLKQLSKKTNIIVKSRNDIIKSPGELGLDENCTSFKCVKNNLKKISSDSIIWGTVSKYVKESYKALDNKGEDQYLLGNIKSDYYKIVIKVYNWKTKKTRVFVRQTTQKNLKKTILILLNKIKKIY